MKNILNKLKKARLAIKQSNLKKSGRNEYSKFDYYTPEQVEQLVDNACNETNCIVLCNLDADEFGLFQTLDFVDLDSEEKITFKMRTKHGSITATNETQQMGGTDTYSERYIKMKVFQIKDNNLDFDSQSGQKENIKYQNTEDLKVEAEKIKSLPELRKFYAKNKGLGKEFDSYIVELSKKLKEEPETEPKEEPKAEAL